MKKSIVYDRHSDCCDAPLYDNDEETPEGSKIIYWFKCLQCKKKCHIKKKK